MGLSKEILNRLLISDDTNVDEGHDLDHLDDGDLLEFEFENDDSPPTLKKPKVHKNTLPLTSKLSSPNADAGPSRIQDATQPTGSKPPKKPFRVRLLSNGNPAPPEHEDVRPVGVEAMFRIQAGEDIFAKEREERERRIRRTLVDANGAKAEYVLTGDPERLVPQLRVQLSLSRDPSPTNSGQIEEITSEEDELLDRTIVEDQIPSSPTMRRIKNVPSPIWALTTGADTSFGLNDLSLGESATPTPRQREKSPENQEIIVPLNSDLAFFNLLTAALNSLSNFHAQQQEEFRKSVEKLCLMISQSIQPDSFPSVVQTPLTPSPLPTNSETSIQRKSLYLTAKSSKKDLYAWREIFTLWIEAEIFESNSERTRGERTIEAAEERLKKFADEVVKRGLGDRRTLRGKRARNAWEEFLRLNVLLLDLKRFQTVNINAARKILKKHDKRTALTASTGFQSFVRTTLTTTSVDNDGNVTSWVFFNTSLPHVLLASLTDTLLPILPSLDDYACLICTSIAFKPIRLNCGHLFCVRCLVKMQRAGKQECPLCRSAVVLLANKDSLDLAVMNFMKEWFPKEVKAKQRENREEIAQEQTQLTGEVKCIIM